METPKPKPVFNRCIFWDVSFDTVDYDGKASFIIERVIEHGDGDDIRQGGRYDGDEKVAEVLFNATYLPKRRLHLPAAVMDNQLPNSAAIS